MKGARFPYLLVGAVLLLLTFVPVSTAIAAEPLRFTVQFDFADVIDCGTFTAIDEGVQVNRVTIFFDNEGNPVGAQTHLKLRAIVTNLTTLKSAVDSADFTFFEDFAEGTGTVAGTALRTTAPGEGIVAKDAGKIVFDAGGNVIFVAGTHDFWLGSGLTALCAAVD